MHIYIGFLNIYSKIYIINKYKIYILYILIFFFHFFISVVV